MNTRKPATDAGLSSAFNTGYVNATASLRTLTKDKVYFNNFYFGFYRADAVLLANQSLFFRNDSSLLITTDVFGDLSGKSYLLISENEFDTLTREIRQSEDPEIDLKMEYAKELDNILSASVITALANQLQLRIYGDIPVVVGKVNGNMDEIIQEDFRAYPDEIYVTAVYFSFEDKPALTPFFIWVVNSKDLKRLENSSVV